MRGLSVAEQGLCFIFDCFVKYQGTWTYLILGIAAILLLVATIGAVAIAGRRKEVAA